MGELNPFAHPSTTEAATLCPLMSLETLTLGSVIVEMTTFAQILYAWKKRAEWSPVMKKHSCTMKRSVFNRCQHAQALPYLHITQAICR